MNICPLCEGDVIDWGENLKCVPCDHIFGKPDVVDYRMDGDAYLFSWKGLRMGKFSQKFQEIIADTKGYSKNAWMLSDFEREDGATLGVVFVDESRAEVVYGSAFDEVQAQMPF